MDCYWYRRPGGTICDEVSRDKEFWLEVRSSGGSRRGALGGRALFLFLDQTEEKFWRPPPPYLRIWMTVPPLSEGLDPPLKSFDIKA